jgi:hypothetical protein
MNQKRRIWSSALMATACYRVIMPGEGVQFLVPVPSPTLSGCYAFEPETAIWPSALMATAYTESLCPVRVCNSSPLSQVPHFQGRILLNQKRRIWSSALMATACYRVIMPGEGVQFLVWSAKSHTFRVFIVR